MIYLDNASSTPMCDSARCAMEELLSSKNGVTHCIDRYKKDFADIFGCDTDELFFSCGGSTGISEALRAVFEYGSSVERTGCVLSEIEHPSVYNSATELAYEHRHAYPKSDGYVHPEDIERLCDGSTACVCLMRANNITGVIQKIPDAYRICKENGSMLFCDSVQAFGDISADKIIKNTDIAVISAHKFGGPKGFGIIYASAECGVNRLLARTERSHPDAVYAAGAVAAAKEVYRHTARIAELKKILVSEILKIEGASLLCPDSEQLTKTAAFLFDGTDGSALASALDLRGVCVSAGAACSQGSTERALTAMGLGDRADRLIRFSLSAQNTEDEIRTACKLTAEAVYTIKKLQRAGR